MPALANEEGKAGTLAATLSHPIGKWARRPPSLTHRLRGFSESQTSKSDADVSQPFPQPPALGNETGLDGGDGFAHQSVIGGGQVARSQDGIGERGEIHKIVAFAEAVNETAKTGIELAGSAARGHGDELALVAQAVCFLPPVVPQVGVDAARCFPGAATGQATAAAQFAAHRPAAGSPVRERLPGGNFGGLSFPDFFELASGLGGDLPGRGVPLRKAGDQASEGRRSMIVGLGNGQPLGKPGQHGKVTRAGQLRGHT